MPKKDNPKIEDCTLRMKFRYDGRKLSPQAKDQLEDIKSEFFEKVLEAGDKITREMEKELDWRIDEDEAPVEVSVFM